VVHGPVLITEALDSGVELEALYVESGGSDLPVTRRARSHGVPVHTVADGALRKVLDVVEPHDVAAVARRTPASLDDVVDRGASGAGPVVVLVAVQDPGNAGTVVRSAEASGCAGVVLTEGSVDVWNPKTVRATAGSVFRLPVADGVGFDAVVEACRRRGIMTWAMVGAGGTALDSADLAGPIAVVVGGEAHGLDEGQVAACDGRLSIPMAGRVESLNAAVSAAVVSFEAARRRRSAAEPTSQVAPALGHNEPSDDDGAPGHTGTPEGGARERPTEPTR
jgi:RNA methyltransferase, TrmH family